MFSPTSRLDIHMGKKRKLSLPAQDIHITQFQEHYKNVNVNGKMIPLLEVNIRENLHDLGMGEIFKQDTISTNYKGED